MKFRELVLCGLSTAVLAACGGGGDSADVEAAFATADSIYSTGCVDNQRTTGSGQRYYEKVDAALNGQLVPGATQKPTVTVVYRSYADTACTTTETSSLTLSGPLTVLTDTKTLTHEPSLQPSLNKTGHKASLLVQSMSLRGITLSVSPLNQFLPFVLIDEDSKLYFSAGSREDDGYPAHYSVFPMKKQ